MQPNGGWPVDYGCFLTKGKERRPRAQETTNLGSREVQEAHAQNKPTRKSV